ncbi:MAG: GDSL-type esterase/lipase family protein [Cyclobacteriaceae bacterium]
MKRLLTALLVCISFFLFAQERPFWKEIQSFRANDSLQPPPEKAIVFVGSSSFKMWKNIVSDFPEHTVINRGFGGSSLPHVIYYADEIVIPYKPRQVVVYCGENDFMSDTVTSEIVVNRFKQLFNLLRKEIRRAEIVFVSMKPSPSRRHLMPQMSAANESIKDFLKGERRAVYVNIWDPMLDSNGAPRKELFLADMLHMNEKGYAIWQKALEPHLK